MKKIFDEIFAIMDQSFPNNEMRTYEGQLALLDREGYKVVYEKNEDGKIIAFMTVWETDNFTFIEHLATTEECRGKGVGSKLLKNYIKSSKVPVILEVEPPETSAIAKRRIGFYERIGFKLNEYFYEQPALRHDTEKCELKIMSYPNFLDKETFSMIQNELYKKIYQV